MHSSSQTSVVVLGMHRSGTSALSGMLNRLGIDFGSQLMTPVKSINDKGFYEHNGIVEIHDNIFRELKYHWSDLRPLPQNWWKMPEVQPYKNALLKLVIRDFNGSPIWGMKDPRTCRLLPIWLEVLYEINCKPVFILCIRHPEEVAKSLNNRDRMKPFVSYVLWLWHILTAEKLTRSYKRSIVFYSDLVEDWSGTCNSLGLDLGINWPIGPENARNEIDHFIDSSLRHYIQAGQTNDLNVGRLSFQLYDIFRHYKLDQCDAVNELFQNEIESHRWHFTYSNQIQVIRELYMSHIRLMKNDPIGYNLKCFVNMIKKYIYRVNH
jgi:hypothetical protein